MTENTVASEQVRTTPRWRIVFLAALIATPVLIGALGFALGEIDAAKPLAVFVAGSAFFGAPSYFLMGGPFFLYGASRGWRSPLAFAALGFAANLAAGPALFLILLSDGGDLGSSLDFARGVVTLGALFAPVYGAVFGAVYRALTRETARDAPASVGSLLRMLLGLAVATYLVAGVALLAWMRPDIGGGVAPTNGDWSHALFAGCALGMLGGVIFFAMRLFERRRWPIWVYAAAGLAMEPLVALVRAGEGGVTGYPLTPVTLALAVLFMLTARLIAGPPEEDAR